MKHTPKQLEYLRRIIIQNPGAIGDPAFFGRLAGMGTEQAKSALETLSREPNPCVVRRQHTEGIWCYNRNYVLQPEAPVRTPSAVPTAVTPHVTTPQAVLATAL